MVDQIIHKNPLKFESVYILCACTYVCACAPKYAPVVNNTVKVRWFRVSTNFISNQLSTEWQVTFAAEPSGNTFNLLCLKYFKVSLKESL